MRLGLGLGLAYGPRGEGDEPLPVPDASQAGNDFGIGVAYALGVDNGGTAFRELLSVDDAPQSFLNPLPAWSLAGLFS